MVVSNKFFWVEHLCSTQLSNKHSGVARIVFTGSFLVDGACLLHKKILITNLLL